MKRLIKELIEDIREEYLMASGGFSRNAAVIGQSAGVGEASPRTSAPWKVWRCSRKRSAPRLMTASS